MQKKHLSLRARRSTLIRAGRVSPSIDTQPDRTNRLLDDDLTGHARTLVRFAVVAVGTGDVELVGHLLTRTVEVVFVGDGIGVDTSRDVVFIEDDVVRERLVVDEFNSLALGDGDGRRLRETTVNQTKQSVNRPIQKSAINQSNRIWVNSQTWTKSTHATHPPQSQVNGLQFKKKENKSQVERTGERGEGDVRRSRVHRCHHRA